MATCNFTKNCTAPQVYLTICKETNDPKSRNTSHIKNLKQYIKAVVCCTILDFCLFTKRENYLWRSVNCSWQTASLQKQHFPSIGFDEEVDSLNSRNTSHFFSTYTIYTFLNKKVTITRCLYICTYLGTQSKKPLQNSW